MTKREELYNSAIDALKGNDDLFCTMVEELDSWDSFADGFRCYPMDELDDLHSGMTISEFLTKITSDFNPYDEYFYYSIYGLESTSDKADLYKSNTDYEEVLDKIIEERENVYFYDSEFESLVGQITEIEE